MSVSTREGCAGSAEHLARTSAAAGRLLCPGRIPAAAWDRFGSPLAYLTKGLETLVSIRKTAQFINNSSLHQWALNACSRLSHLQIEGNTSREFNYATGLCTEAATERSRGPSIHSSAGRSVWQAGGNKQLEEIAASALLSEHLSEPWIHLSIKLLIGKCNPENYISAWDPVRNRWKRRHGLEWSWNKKISQSAAKKVTRCWKQS